MWDTKPRLFLFYVLINPVLRSVIDAESNDTASNKIKDYRRKKFS